MKVLLMVLTVGMLIAADAKDDAAKKDLENLQGTWILVSAVRDGEKVSEAEVKKIRLTVTGNKFSFSQGSEVGTSQKGTFTVDPSKKPKATDSTATVGPDKGKKFLGIYKIKGDMHTVCFAPSGKERPTVSHRNQAVATISRSGNVRRSNGRNVIVRCSTFLGWP